MVRSSSSVTSDATSCPDLSAVAAAAMSSAPRIVRECGIGVETAGRVGVSFSIVGGLWTLAREEDPAPVLEAEQGPEQQAAILTAFEMLPHEGLHARRI